MTFYALFGGFLFGVGAAVTGACAYSTMARLVDGEGGMLMTIAGFGFGVLGFVALLNLHWLSRPVPVPTLVGMLIDWAWHGAIYVAAEELSRRVAAATRVVLQYNRRNADGLRHRVAARRQ